MVRGRWRWDDGTDCAAAALEPTTNEDGSGDGADDETDRPPPPHRNGRQTRRVARRWGGAPRIAAPPLPMPTPLWPPPRVPLTAACVWWCLFAPVNVGPCEGEVADPREAEVDHGERVRERELRAGERERAEVELHEDPEQVARAVRERAQQVEHLAVQTPPRTSGRGRGASAVLRPRALRCGRVAQTTRELHAPRCSRSERRRPPPRERSSTRRAAPPPSRQKRRTIEGQSPM